MENTSGNAHTDMVSLWYEFLCDSFAKPFSAMLTLIWFLFGMSSYVSFCKTFSTILILK